MNEAVHASFDATERTRKDVLKQLLSTDFTYASIEDLLSKYRRACENYIFLDFEAAARNKAEAQLWDTHVKINNHFRGRLAKFRDGEGKKKVVEKRRLEKHYLDFVKASMRFYRGYIQRLASHFADVPDILQIAHKFSLGTLTADTPIRASPLLQKVLLRSCHATLIQLGDLSRYRETELQQKERNWGPARGYYDLAAAIDPTSGASYNQLAVIARNDGDHLRAVYYLYRALAVENPQPLARDNLSLEFKKILTKDTERTLIPIQDAGRPGSGLQAWFLAFHANCARGIDSRRRREQEAEFLTQLAVDLKERPLDGTLNKFVLINIAAENLARLQDEESHIRSSSTTAYFIFNLKVFFVLLGILVSELGDLDEAAIQDDSAGDSFENVTAVVRRVLPALRHYSSWLRTSSSYLHLETDETVVTHVREFWKRYAEALTVLTTTFNVGDLPSVTYLLEEDLDTVAFTPLSTGASADRYRMNDQPKPKIGDADVQRLHPNQEMRVRIRGLVLDGLQIVVDDENKKHERLIPMRLEGTRFEYCEAHLAAGSFPVSHGQSSHSHTQSAGSVTRDDIEQAKRQSLHRAPPNGMQEDLSESASTSVSTGMHHMIDGLVGSEMSDDVKPLLRLTPFSLEESNTTPGVGTVDASQDAQWGVPDQQYKTLTAQDLVNQMLRSQNDSTPGSAPSMEREETVRPLMSSFSETPFAPLSGGMDSPRSRPTTAHRMQPDSSTPVPLSSGSAFQQDILRRQQQLQMHPTPISSPFLPSSWSYQETPVVKHFPPLQPSPLMSSPLVGLASPHFHEDEVPRKAPAPAMFGAIGQTPPSAQAG